MKGGTQRGSDAAPSNPSGDTTCPTCGAVIPESVTVLTINGPVINRGYQLDHFPRTWAERVTDFQSQPTPPTRAEVLDAYNLNLRVQCGPCNMGHQFEGVAGDYQYGVDGNGNPLPAPTGGPQ